MLQMALGTLMLLAAVVAVRGIDPRVPPKFVRASYGLQKALYAEKFGYSLVPIPNNILAHLNKSKTIGPASRVGRSRKGYRPRSRGRRRRRPKRPIKYRRPNSYGLPTYAKRYKHYIPQRRPYRYKKRNRLRGPTRYRDPMDFDYYEQDISDYDDYGPGDYDYDRSEYDREFMNRHAELYNGGYNPGLPRWKMRENKTHYPDQSRPSYYHEEDDRYNPVRPRGKVREIKTHQPGQTHYYHEDSDGWEDFRIPLSPKRERDKPSWTSSSRRPFSAAIAAPSRPVTLREPPTNHKSFNWDPKSSSYKVVDNSRSPRPEEHYYVDEYDNRKRHVDEYRRDSATYVDYKRTDPGQTRMQNRDEDIGFGQGMEVVDDRFAGWTVSR